MKSLELQRGRVSFSAREEYRVLVMGQELDSEPSGALRAFGELPCVGDWVQLRVADELGLIEEVEPRRTAFVRKAAGRGHESQCVAANVDVAMIVCGLDGDFEPRRIERYLVLAKESGAQPIVVLNKADESADLVKAINDTTLIAGGSAVIAISARQSVDPLLPWLQGDATAVLLGSSGAGKTTIANALLGKAEAMATQPVREHDSRGRHTTTARMLVALPTGAWLIDTPGMRELGLLATDGSLDSAFPDIAELALQCRFADCTHSEEPGCAVRAAVETGEIEGDRWESYRKLQREARHNAIAADGNAQRAEKLRWRTIHKANKRMYRDRGR